MCLLWAKAITHVGTTAMGITEPSQAQHPVLLVTAPVSHKGQKPFSPDVFPVGVYEARMKWKKLSSVSIPVSRRGNQSAGSLNHKFVVKECCTEWSGPSEGIVCLSFLVHTIISHQRGALPCLKITEGSDARGKSAGRCLFGGKPSNLGTGP